MLKLQKGKLLNAAVDCAVLFLPGLLLSLSAGAIFGLAVGCIVVFVGAVLGETGAFVLGRCGPAVLSLLTLSTSNCLRSQAYRKWSAGSETPPFSALRLLLRDFLKTLTSSYISWEVPHWPISLRGMNGPQQTSQLSVSTRQHLRLYGW